ncbi:terminase small subunit [Haloactinopolyspora alba]|nr:hypothetical protein [Haloactinopolyspora alba]
MTSAFTKASKAAHRKPVDGAAVALARVYARQIDDDPSRVDKLGPQMLAVLTQLGMTPKARGGQAEPQAGGDRVDRVDELRDRRASRADRAAAVDSPDTPATT